MVLHPSTSCGWRQGGTHTLHPECRYLDSDGVNGYANALLAGNTSSNPTYNNVARRAPIDAMDGAWHMVTVTSWAQGTPGYR